MDVKNFLDACRLVVGESNLVTEVDTSVVSGSSRMVPAIVFPSSTEEVREIILAANRFLVPISPVSTGRNWGMGSFLPASNGSVVVSLERMNLIRNVNIPCHSAVIEAGVTQGQLADHLEFAKAPLVLDATGSARQTSIIGCALDRGFAYNAPRLLSNLEIVLGNGEILKTGFGHFENAVATQAYKEGIGPSLDGVFVQSNLGIVTSATVELIPKPKCHVVFVAKVRAPSDLPTLIERLHSLKKQGVLRSVPHIANRARTEITLAPAMYEYFRGRGKLPGRSAIEAMVRSELPSEWSMVGSLSGSLCHVLEGVACLSMAMKGLGKIIFVNDTVLTLASQLLSALDFIPAAEKKLAFLRSSQEVFGMTSGTPSNTALRSVYWPIMDDTQQYTDPDKGEAGLLYCQPVIPVESEYVEQTLAIIEGCFRNYGFTPYITLSLLENSLTCVVNLAFDRRNHTEVSNAHSCVNRLFEELARAGFYPYRAGIDFMDHVLRDDSFWRTVREIKRAVDPNDIIAPGRYCLR